MDDGGSHRFKLLEKIFTAISHQADRFSKWSHGILANLSAGGEHTQQDVLTAIHEGHEQGVVTAREAVLIRNIFAFDDKEAKDIMIHRTNLVALSDDTLLKDAISYAIEQNKSRIPIYHEDIDNIRGQIHIKDLLGLCMQQSDYDKRLGAIPGLIREIDLIPEITKLDVLFRQMQMHKRHLAIVIDEYGQTAGLIALEDILEEIVGEIEDEYDGEEVLIKPMTHDTYLIRGEASYRNVAELLKITHPEQLELDIDTMNGFVVSQIGHIPSENEKIEFESDGYHFQVTGVENKTIQSVVARKLAVMEN